MTALKRWTPTVGKPEAGGAALFEFEDRRLILHLCRFEDAQALDELLDLVILRTRRRSAKTTADWLRRSADGMEAAS